MKSKAFELFTDKKADELRFLGDALNNQLSGVRIEQLSDEDQRDLVDDLTYLCSQAEFHLTFPLRFHKNGDRYVCEFVCVLFEELEPSEVDAWLELMTTEQRCELYMCIDCVDQKRYLSAKLLQCLLEDFNQE